MAVSGSACLNRGGQAGESFLPLCLHEQRGGQAADGCLRLCLPEQGRAGTACLNRMEGWQGMAFHGLACLSREEGWGGGGWEYTAHPD